MFSIRHVLVVAPLVLLVGCVSTQELPLAPNVVRLDTQASGRLFVGQSVPQTMRRAAELTLAAGYTHFRLDQATSQQGSQLGGFVSSGSSTSEGTATASRFGNSILINGSSTGNSQFVSTPIYRPTSNVGVTVIMLRKGDAGIEQAFDAATVLKQYGS